MNGAAWTPYGAPPMPERPATALKVFGVVGARSAKGFGAGGPTSPAVDAGMQAMAEYTDTATRVAAVEGGLMLLMDIALFVIGLLLFQRRESGRTMAIAWSVAAFLVLAGRAATFEIVLWPKFEKFWGTFSASMPASPSPGSGSGGLTGIFGMMTGFAHAGEYVSLLFMAIFPACLVIFMTLASVKAQVRQPGE